MGWYAAWRLKRALANAPRVSGQSCVRCKRAIEEWCGRCPQHGYICFRCVQRKPLRTSVWCPACKGPLQQCAYGTVT